MCFSLCVCWFSAGKVLLDKITHLCKVGHQQQFQGWIHSNRSAAAITGSRVPFESSEQSNKLWAAGISLVIAVSPIDWKWENP